MIRALLFDLDGTLWDSEVVRFRSWDQVFRQRGVRYPLESYATRLGTIGGRDPLDDLEAALGEPIDRPAVGAEREEMTERGLDDLAPKPGIEAYLEEGRRRGLLLGVVSTDERSYVVRSLERLGLADGWDVICTADRDPARAKPSPALYLEALDRLAVSPEEAIAFEDSPNGILAATRAGIFCVAVRHEVTETMDLSNADLVVGSLAEIPLDEVIRVAERGST